MEHVKSYKPRPVWSPCKVCLLCHSSGACWEGGSNNLGALEPMHLVGDRGWFHIETHPSPHELPRRIRSLYVKRYDEHTEIRWIRVSCLQVTQGHRQRDGSIAYLWLPINDPCTSRIRFRDRRRFQSKNAKFFHSLYYPPLSDITLWILRRRLGFRKSMV